MPARPPAWLTPEDEAHQLVEELIKTNAPHHIIARAERVREWNTVISQTFAQIGTLSHGGPFCPTALNQSRQNLDTAPWKRPRLERLRSEN